MSIHCRFCKGLIVPWKQMHNSCSRVVERLYADDQWRNDPAYRLKQAQMRWKEEDKL